MDVGEGSTDPARFPDGEKCDGGEGHVFLNCDVQLVKDVVLDADGKSSCAFNGAIPQATNPNLPACKDASTIEMANDFRDNDPVFYNALSPVFLSMINKGLVNGVIVN